jgi:Diguanylate cyclase, GGDEF domain
MRFKATHDALTSLWNRGEMMDLLSRELARSNRERSCTAILLCDIDHFKTVNDTHGHGEPPFAQARAEEIRKNVGLHPIQTARGAAQVTLSVGLLFSRRMWRSALPKLPAEIASRSQGQKTRGTLGVAA